MERMKRIERMAPDNTGTALLPAGDTLGRLVTQEQSRPSPAADAETPPPRSAHVALVVSCSVSSQVASRQAHTDVAAPTPIDRAERANKWVVLALVGTAAFMTTLDASIVNIGLPSIAHSFGVQLSGSIE